MTDMTPEQALARMFERLDAIDGNFEWTQERDIIRNALSRPAVPVGYAGVAVWIGDKQVTRIVDRVALESSRADALLYEFKSARNMLGPALSRPAVPAELAELLDRLSPPGHGIALKGDPTQTFHTGHDVYLAQRVKAWLRNQAPAPAGAEGWRKAMKRLVLVARTTGGTAGPDADLMAACAACEDLLAAAPEPAEQHPDDAAVDQFAQVMKAKLAKARAKGRSGWDDPAQCSPEYLADLLAGHVRKGNDGNFVDVANFAMMLHQRGAAPSVMPDAIRRSTAEESLGDAGEPEHTLCDLTDLADLAGQMQPRLDRIAPEILKRRAEGARDAEQPEDESAAFVSESAATVKAERAALRQRVRELEAERTRLRAGLDFYAKQASYSPSWTVGATFHVMEDKGRVARNALESAAMQEGE